MELNKTPPLLDFRASITVNCLYDNQFASIRFIFLRMCSNQSTFSSLPTQYKRQYYASQSTDGRSYRYWKTKKKNILGQLMFQGIITENWTAIFFLLTLCVEQNIVKLSSMKEQPEK